MTDIELSLLHHCVLSGKIVVNGELLSDEGAEALKVLEAIIKSSKKLSTESFRTFCKIKKILPLFHEVTESEPGDLATLQAEIIGEYNRRLLVTVMTTINENLEAEPVNVYKKVNDLLTKFHIGNQRTMAEKILEYKAQKTGSSKKQVMTSLKSIDNFLPILLNRLILVAGEKKVGKTRFMINLISRFVRDPNTNVTLFSLEMSFADIMDLITGIGGEELVSFFLTNGNLDIIDDISDIDKMADVMNRKTAKKKVYVIDNLGFVECTKLKDADEYIAKKLKQCKQVNNATIFLLHHLTKEAGKSSNLQDGYMPRLENVRGSGRVMDFADAVWLVHRPSHYRDLMAEVKSQISILEYEALEKLFLVECALNRHGSTHLVRLLQDIKICDFKDFKL